MPYMVRILVLIAMTNIRSKQNGPRAHSLSSLASVHMKHGKQKYAYTPTHIHRTHVYARINRCRNDRNAMRNGKLGRGTFSLGG